MRGLAPILVMLWLAAATAKAAEDRGRRPIVVGFERFHSNGEASVAGGQILATELSCTACHSAPANADLGPKRGPNLDGIGTRVAAEWIRAFIADPQATKPGTTMPDVLAGLPAERRAEAADALAQFLTSSSPKMPAAKLPSFSSAGRGQVLFHEIGCAVCHGPDPGGNQNRGAVEPGASFVPLPDIPAKYALNSLSEFLQHPLDHRPGGRMPDLQLDAQDATDIAAYLLHWEDEMTKDARGIKATKSDAADTSRGLGFFNTLGCAECHQLAGGKPSPGAKAFDALSNFDTGCAGAAPSAGAPFFHLSSQQRKALSLAAGHPVPPAAAAERVVLTLERLNCLACHERNGLGGPTPHVERFFTGEAELANEGRFPPRLTNVGQKLTPQWIAGVLGKEGRIRPYLHTRMPVFGADAVARLPREFVEADGGMKSDPAKAFLDGDAEAGRKLLGSSGLSCITCHGLRGHAAIGIHAADLTDAVRRLQPEWFKANLLNPAGLRPGTLMPAFWPEGKAVNPDILGGSTDKQIGAIWAFLRDGKGDPDGYPPPKGDFELVAAEKAVLLRCFMKGVGTHAIAAGFPQKINIAFDANGIRPALAWRGKFLDAYSTWFSRAQPPVEPLGTDVIALPATMPLARLDSPGAQWPPATGTDAGYRFSGYRLDKKGIPTFLYRFGETTIEDRLSPSNDGRGLLRSIVVQGKGDGLYFQPGQAKGLTVRMAGPAADADKPAAATPQPVRFDAGGEARFNLEYQW